MKDTDIQNIKQFLDSLLAASRPDSPAWNIELQLGHIEPCWNYIDGCMIKAVLDLYDVTGEQSYLDFADRFVDHYVAEDGEILGFDKEEYSSDNINEGKVLFDLYRLTGKEKYKRAIFILREQLESYPRTSTGNFWHKKIYPNQVWLDGLYMIQPFYMAYEMAFGEQKNVSDILRQFEVVHTRMRDEKTGLLYHGYDDAKECFWADKTTGLSPHFWTRSLGWYAMALVDTAEKMEGGLSGERQQLLKYLREVLDALVKVADEETGMFYQIPDLGDREGNYLETSGTCAIAYALMKGARLGYLPDSYFAIGELMLQSVIDHKLATGEDGAFVLKDICLVAGLGVYPGRGDYEIRDGSYEYYISEPKVDNDAKGVAPFLFAFAELYRREKQGR